MKSMRRELVRRTRLATASYRALPDFLIIGAQKCGTTSLFHYLGQHPQLVPSFGKEVHYFDGGLTPSDDNFGKGERWYRANFPLRRTIKRGDRTFEASPLYMFHPLAPRRIHDLLPRAKLIALLRNPTERAISHYFHSKQRGLEDLSISDALHREDERLAPVMKSGAYNSSAFIHHSYQSRGLYLPQLQRYLEYFSRERILILSSEELFSRPAQTLRTVFEFVEVDPAFEIADLTVHNIGRDKHDVETGVYDHLDANFRAHNEALCRFLGRNFGW